jgi:Xaa-Pro aminopeptidase
MFDKNIYVARRQKLKTAMGSGMIIFLGNDNSSINYKDNFYSFRQDSTFLYFFGIDRPGIMAVIDIDNDREILFGDDLSIEQMVWTGFQDSLESMSQKTGMSLVKERKQFEPVVKKAQADNNKIHCLPPYRLEQVEILRSALGNSPSLLNDIVSKDLITSIVALRSIKSAEEVAEITRAVNITVDMQVTAMRMATEGITEAQIAGVIHGLAISAGGNLSFPTILTVNGQVLHNGYTQSLLHGGQLVLCDCGAETAMHYSGDLTRTFPVNESYSTMQKEIYSIVLHAYEAATALLKPGVLYRDIHLFACEKLTEGLVQLGLMKGNPRDAVAHGAHALFFPCGLGHMMGLDTHDMENLGEIYVGYDDEIKQSTQFGLKSLRLGRALREGFVLTVEPGLYFIPELIDQWAAEKKHSSFINYENLEGYRSLGGIRIEEDFLITSSGCQLLGKQLAKTTNEIEGFRRSSSI